MLSPKAEFSRHEQAAKELATVTRSDNFAFAASMALAEFVSRDTPTQEQLIGAKRFLDVLMTLAEKDKEPSQFPVRRLNHSALDPAQPQNK